MNNRSGLKLCKQRKKVWLFTLFFLLISLSGLITSTINPNIGKPLRPGIEFTGGSQIIFERVCVQDCKPINSSKVNSALITISKINSQDEKFPNLSNSRVQILDNSRSLLIRLPFLTADQSDIVSQEISREFGPFIPSSISIDTIGPTLGKRLLNSSLLSLIVSFIGIALYINFRYDKRFSFLALLALGHDVFLVCGLFAWLGLLKNIEVDSLFAVSLLTIAGYSVNNTVVVFDRIRERSLIDKELQFEDQIDNAVSATLTRTIYTSLTTLLPLICILIWGGSTLYWFAISLSFGVLAGSWSSIALAPSLLSALNGETKSNNY